MITYFKNLDKFFIIILTIIFFIYNLERIDYGLPFFLNLDELAFQFSTLGYLQFITGYSTFGLNPIYAPLINLVLILKSIFINEYLINSLSLEQIKSKIYFNTELFIYYGRVASLIISSFSIIVLYFIFKKLKINFLIYSILLISFSTSTALLDISIINGKNSYFLLIFLIQIYFFIKYLVNIKKFEFRSYIIFGLLASIAWGVNYWPAFISIYAVFFLHIQKYNFTKIHYLLIFLMIFIFCGPVTNFMITNVNSFEFIDPARNKSFEFFTFIRKFINELIISGKIIYHGEKNIFLLLIFAPIFLLHKKTKFKREFILIFFLILEPLVLFGISDEVTPQLRYFIGSFSIIIILTGLIFNELLKTKFKYAILIIIFYNFSLIYNNVLINNKINNLITNNHSFFQFNKNINLDRSKVLYLVDLSFQESLKQNLLYIDLYDKNMIKKNQIQKDFYNRIKNKIKKINNKISVPIENKDLKKDLIYFNYTFFEINNYDLFFNYIKKDFKYVVIEESRPLYLSSTSTQQKVKDYVKNNFLLEYKLFKDDKIYFRSLRSAIHYYSNTLYHHDFDKPILNHELQKVYGNNYSLYKLM